MPGKSVKDFSLPSTSGDFRLSALRGTKVVLYFYPKDNTPGCTVEGQQFGDLHKQFLAAGAHVYGVSRDSVRSHEGFRTKTKLPFELLSDCEEKVCTFVIDPQGLLAREWRGVKVPGHAQEVLDFVKTL